MSIKLFLTFLFLNVGFHLLSLLAEREEREEFKAKLEAAKRAQLALDEGAVASASVLIPLRSGLGSNQLNPSTPPAISCLNPFEIRAGVEPPPGARLCRAIPGLNPFEIRAGVEPIALGLTLLKTEWS